MLTRAAASTLRYQNPLGGTAAGKASPKQNSEYMGLMFLRHREPHGTNSQAMQAVETLEELCRQLCQPLVFTNLPGCVRREDIMATIENSTVGDMAADKPTLVRNRVQTLGFVLKAPFHFHKMPACAAHAELVQSYKICRLSRPLNRPADLSGGIERKDIAGSLSGSLYVRL